ncbi:putative multisite-specific tRNA:(cytosine-C(5))-methyltransferase [Medicago truncatula]|uniref:Putative multisite-specific tRNA:(Cytosine-C(5))-methyltransferase n=1 Tax=Medicago truncatula TaxID=3880 RepID=A0A396GN75_MEDTR|nr:putative multisite-specific tRNA:(cytosine-C(5))-methyltransferase [Medicago truncatula]
MPLVLNKFSFNPHIFCISLQLNLLTNGFRLLKVGGSLVYSTCSLTVAQNEDVMEQFLKENITAGRIFILHFFTYIQNYFEWPVLNISCFLV